MTPAEAWASTDTKPRFSILGSNVWQDGDEWDSAMAKLQRWLDDPSQLEDDDVEPPSRPTIRLAISLAKQARSQGLRPPTRVMPNGEEGLVLEWTTGNITSMWEIEGGQHLEIARYENGRCMARSRRDLSDFVPD